MVTGEEAKGNRRNVSGLDQRRVPMVAAIVAQHGPQSMKTLAARELYVATVGGMTLLEPSADLAVGVALASAVTQRPVRENMVVIGELGLAGEVRRVPDIGRRLKEAARMGFTRAAVPKETDTAQAPKGLRLVRVGTIAEAIDAALD